MRIITVSREFGSGGREVGKRLADELGFAYYDREIISEIAKNTKMDENYIDHVLEKGVFSTIPITFGTTFAFLPNDTSGASSIYAEQQKVIRKLSEKSDCIIVGRNADILLHDQHPFRVFVYSDMPSKIARCKSRENDSEKMSDREIEKMIKQIDKARAGGHNIISDIAWGDKRGYDLCINTTNTEIKSLIKPLSDYALRFFEK